MEHGTFNSLFKPKKKSVLLGKCIVKNKLVKIYKFRLLFFMSHNKNLFKIFYEVYNENLYWVVNLIGF